MYPVRTPWEVRLDWSLSVLHWGSLALGLFLSGISDGVTPSVTLAAMLAATYVIAMQALPRRLRDHEIVGEILAVSGVVVALLSISLTGGIGSPYVLFLAAPSFFAGAFLGFRVGLETALLGSTGLLAVVSALRQEILTGSVFQAIILYVLIAVTFSQARRLLVEERARSDALEAASALTMERMERLETAHNLLTSLSELANAAELNPVTVGEAALRDLALVVPFSAGEVVLNDDDGAVVVARRGEEAESENSSLYPMLMAGSRLGHLELWPTTESGLEDYQETIRSALQPVALAFDNIVLLQEIAQRAVREERARVARDLHDDIGPSLASLGLAIDMAIHQFPTAPELARHLDSVRRHVTMLVENVRTTVSDLRHEATESLVELCHRAAAEAGAEGPAIIVELTEERPPRPLIADQLGAILTEAIRNAVAHAEASSVRVTGAVDRDRGRVTVTDDGKGFDTSIQPEGHFGLLGMRERADKIEVELVVTSEPGHGTVVTVAWGS
ncbi:MAG: sensor histidine kinase [Acidimicrobiia bacterium]